jgi:hypothetical protein
MKALQLMVSNLLQVDLRHVAMCSNMQIWKADRRGQNDSPTNVMKISFNGQCVELFKLENINIVNVLPTIFCMRRRNII